MKNIIIVIIYCFLLSVCLIGCASLRTCENSYLRLESVDEKMFSAYFVLDFKDNEGKTFYVLSDKNKYETFDESKYEKLESNKLYYLELLKVDSLVSADLSYQLDKGGGAEIIINNQLFWKNGKIMVVVYKSIDIKGVYVLREKRINK